MKKAKLIVEWAVIGLAIAVVTSVISIITYREVINSDWYIEKRTEKAFSDMCERVNEAENISYIKIQVDGDDRDIYDVPAELFDDIGCDSYEKIDDIEKRIEIFNEPCAVVFFKDGSYTSFFITDSGDVYYDTLKITCPSLAEWYDGHK